MKTKTMFSSILITLIIFSSTLFATTANLTKEEVAYLKEKKEIKMCIDPDWMPLEKIVHGKAIGYTSDFMQLLSKQLNKPITLVETKTWSESLKNIEHRRCDIIPMIAITPKLKKHMNFTSSYLSLQIVLATKTCQIYINNLENHLDKNFAVVKNYALHEYLNSKYPNLKIINVHSIHDGLKKVAKGEVFAYIDNSAVITYGIQKKFFSTVAITGTLDFKLHYSIGTRNDEKILNSIFDKAILSVNHSQKEDIENRWFKFKQEAMLDYELIIKIVIIFVVLSIIGITLLFISRRNNTKLKIVQEEIKALNSNLKKRVEIEVEKNKQQQLLMFKQSRLAQMGEIINMIAHQWRQPLSSINGLIMVMDIKRSKQNLENRLFLEEEFNEIESLTAHMSSTIDDFRNFFKPDKEKTNFYLKNTIEHTLSLIKPILKHREIEIHTNYQKDIRCIGYPNEFGQAIVNIITNSKDALLLNTENKKKEIYIFLSKKDNTITLSIQDNAKGIDPKLINKIFDPYFSTKPNKNGTGLGLYISKMIIEEHMEGKLTLTTNRFGTIFKIEFKIS